MIGPLGRLGAAATLGQHCPQMTQRRCMILRHRSRKNTFGEYFTPSRPSDIEIQISWEIWMGAAFSLLRPRPCHHTLGGPPAVLCQWSASAVQACNLHTGGINNDEMSEMMVENINYYMKSYEVE